MLSDQIIEYIEIFIAMVFVAQFGFGIALLVLGKVMMEYYEWGIFRPATNWFQKSTNLFMKGTIGAGPYFYARLIKYPWIITKLLFAITLIFMGLTSIVLYYILTWIINILLG
ncbi:hypothetical protein RYX56_15400 [Alkalihalophilus lindianensis]|uniref:YggT family protein n=1 Tax=Alkalihalophilus lindianensis TaxID=1630542 RepID=A0ABU3XCX7_9BACI|nr:hypothetical protein [Alkalihalophilus lindianensis]MDV2685751.1 hypothetical protein [Alkalihalophilus lindianensis]